MVSSGRAKSNRNKKRKGKLSRKKENFDNANNTIDDGVDFLSLLPDDILIKILSQLRIRNAITTSVLSHRWRNLWPQITSLNIVNADCLNDNVINVLPQLIYIHKLTLCYYRHNINTANYIDSLFRGISGRNIYELTVLYIYDYTVSQHTTFINHIFQFPSLKVLELGYYGYLHYDIANALAFPCCLNLKVLKLRFTSYNDDYAILLDKYLKSCPSLEGLSLMFWGRSFYHKPVDSKPMIVDAPKLKYLKMDCFHLAKVFFTNNVTSLQKVDLSREFGTLNVDGSGQLLNIFQVSSKARYLTLGSHSLTMDDRLPMFASLVRLNCILDCLLDMKNVLAFLRRCPMLETIILNFTPHFSGLEKHSERLQCDLEPTSLVTLKRVEMNMPLHLLNGGAFYIVKYWLRSAGVLERLIINVTGGKNEFTKIAQCEELQICKDIFALPRKSLLCQVEYFGISLKSSDFERKFF